MLRFSIFFVLGVLLFHQLAELPDWWWLGVAAALMAFIWRLSVVRPILALVLGFAWSHAYALTMLPAQLPGDDAVLRLVVSGQILSLPKRSHGRASFVFEARTIEGLGETQKGLWRLHLSWRDPAVISVGETWRLPVRLRAVHGYASPGSWDYEGWLYWQGIRYKGYVSADGMPQPLPAEPCCRLTRLRAMLGAAIDDVPASSFARGVIRAITIGDKSGLTPEAKALFRATGTSHLMAISGLHIGLLAGLGMFVVTWSWRRLPPLCGRVPARLAGAVAGLTVATLYALLAGMGLPTQRALIMLAAFTFGLLFRQTQNTLHVLAAAAAAVLIWHPPSVISAGFWLSFGAVLAILATLRWNRRRPAWYQAILVQLGISLALWPILALFGMPASSVAPVVNLVLVPIFGLIVVPVSLLGAMTVLVAPVAGNWMLAHLAELLNWVRYALEFSGGLPFPPLGSEGLDAAGFLILLTAVVLLLAPPGVPLRWLAVPLAGIVWLPPEPELSTGGFDVHVLDVGQGLSTVVETRSHTLIFDTGPEYPSGFSTAVAVIEPFLAKRRRRLINRLVLSHGDRDHAGGVGYLMENLEVRSIQSGEPVRVGNGASQCLAGERWQWDGVVFEYLYPASGAAVSGNDASCVLRISNAAGAILLTGDIGAMVERQLVRSMPYKLGSHAVVVSHHGSRSSSAEVFAAATAPVYAMYSTGWANRYGFPAPEIVRRWRQVGATGLDTASLGTISLRFRADGRISAPTSYRLERKRFWWHDSGSAEPVHAVSSGD